MKQFIRARLRLLVVMIVLMLVSVSIAPATTNAEEHCHLVEPEFRQITEITYYSDARHTIEVGFEMWLCNGHIYFEGERTPYSDIVRTDYCPINGGGSGGSGGGGGGGDPVPPPPHPL